eukprot:CAMPEP_0183581106 /NCGR_PEP_ID=MMETSP0371-20130417/147037_1 /TAXON_ID=268820 /ORGANISM="Peridinium aciculiferum, Strain PAER-2" /LENGTH=45 /DNA_ID= /DNA_START= /DNA_END= /DNA_ORIENTATION=
MTARLRATMMLHTKPKKVLSTHASDFDPGGGGRSDSTALMADWIS